MTALLFVGCDSADPSGEEDPEDGESNEAPSAVADANNTTVNTGTEVTLDASSSEDPDGDDLSYSWSLNMPDESTASLSDASAEQPTFTPDVAGDYVATIDVSDGTESSTDNVTVTAEAASTQEISSNITSDRTLTSDQQYLVTTMVGVENGATLTIDPGVTIMFEADAGFSVNDDNSALVASGTSSDQIRMVGTERNEGGWWQGIAFYSNNPNNELNYVTIEYAGSERWSSMSDAANVGLNTDSELSLTNSTITNSGQHGVYCDEPNQENLSGSGNSISNNVGQNVSGCTL